MKAPKSTSRLSLRLYDYDNDDNDGDLRLEVIRSQVWWPVQPHFRMASDGSSSVGDGHR